MARHRVLLDCDPGVDDAVAMLLAFASPDEIELLAVTCVGGNHPLSFVERNARRIRDLAGRGNVPVHAGCDRPLLGGGASLSSAHGTDGLGDIGLPEPSLAAGESHAVDVLIDAVMGAPGEITLCAVGPLTNVALALLKEPRLAQAAREIVVMGGAAFGPGNVTPSAEFNVFVDPHAARVVFGSGAKLTLFGLDVTRRARLAAGHLQSLAGSGRAGRATAAMIRACGADACLHDPCVIAHLIDPTLFSGVDAHVEVECESRLTRGQTVAAVYDKHLQGRAPNCRVMTSVAADRFSALLAERLSAL
jgi:purine nucleosidase